MEFISTQQKLQKDKFLQQLIEFLYQVTPSLREIKAKFPDVPQIDRKIDIYIDEGIIYRENKRYYLFLKPSQTEFPIAEIVNQEIELLKQHKPDIVFFYHYFNQLRLSQPEYLLVDKMPIIYQIEKLNCQKNGVSIYFLNDINGLSFNLFNYFKHQFNEELSEKEESINQLIGDVNPEYALKHMTIFLLKFISNINVTRTRKDVLIDAMAEFGMIQLKDGGEYQLITPYFSQLTTDMTIINEIEIIEQQFLFDYPEKLHYLIAGQIHRQVYQHFLLTPFSFWTIE